MTVVADGGEVFGAGGASAHVDAVTTISVALPVGQEVTLEVFPGGGDLLKLLVLRPSHGSSLTVKASDGANESGAFPLDGAQVFTGDITAVLGVAPNQLVVNNTGQEDASLDAFVARNVVA